MKNVTNGIYLITERATGKMYVGLAKRRDGIEGRWRNHKERFPQDLFIYEILLPCPPETTREELSNLEKFYIKELDCMEPKGFNRTSGGCGKTEVSEETRKRVSAALKGIPMSEEQKAKRRGKTPANKGKPGRALTDEQRAKQSAALKGRAAPNKGKPMSEEQKAKQSAVLKGRPGRVQSEEEKAKRSAMMKGRVSPNKGKPMSEEQKKKTSEAVKARLALKRAAKAAAEIEAPEELLDSSSFNNLDTSVIT